MRASQVGLTAFSVERLGWAGDRWGSAGRSEASSGRRTQSLRHLLGTDWETLSPHPPQGLLPCDVGRAHDSSHRAGLGLRASGKNWVSFPEWLRNVGLESRGAPAAGW